MKIGINLRLLNPRKIGGMEVYVRNLLNKMLLIDDNVEYLLFVTGNNADTFKLGKENIKKCFIDHKDYTDTIKKSLQNEGVDVYFCPLLILDPLFINIPSVINIPDMQHEFFPDFFPSDVLNWRKKYFGASARIADAVLTLSEFSKQTIADKLEIDKDKIYAVHLAAEDKYKFKLDNDKKKLIMEKYAIPEQFGFYPANTWPHKNHKNLLLSLDLYRKKYGEPPKFIFTGGEGEWHEEMLKLIKEYNLETYIRHLGYVDEKDIPYIYANASFLVFPSLYEGFGLPVIEAMEIGCPAICSNATSLPEVAGNAALYFDPLNPEEIADKINRIIMDTELRRSLIEKGKLQTEKFSWDLTAEKTLEILKGVSRQTPEERRKMYPLVSIVTPSFNQGEFIEDTIKSVLSEDYLNIEYIVMDGGSTDNTLEILKKYGNEVKWFSEPDKGQADAVNKGFKKAVGEILGWLNSDDTYNPGAISKTVEFFLTNPEAIMVYGDAYYIDKEGKIIGEYPAQPFNLEHLANFCFICQPSVFLKREAIEKIGALDINLYTCMDFDYWIRVGKFFGDSKIGYLKGEFLANSRMYAENKTSRMRKKVYIEIMDTVKRHVGYISDSWIYGYVKEVMMKEKFDESNRTIKGIIEFIYIIKLFGRHWGRLYFWRFFNERLKNLTGNYYLKIQNGKIYPDGWVSKYAIVNLKNNEKSKKLLLEGQHLWPYKYPLKIKVILNGEKIRCLVIKEKGSFNFAIELPDKHRKEDILIITLKPNKTFVPSKLGINDDERRLSFILKRIDLL